MIRQPCRAKILATLGPATEDPDTIHRMALAGADLFRINFSHGTHKDKPPLVQAIRDIERDLNRPLGVLIDLQGPKLRIGTFRDGAIALTPGQRLRFDLDETPGDATRVCLPHPEVLHVLHPNATLLMDDGKVKLTVVEAGTDYCIGEVVYGQKLSERKGFNLPDVALPVSALTQKDREDLDFGLSLGVDWVALSFVQRPSDVVECKQLTEDKAAVMAKLEKPQAIDHLAEIVNVSDGIMVARGDLGVETPPELVPSLQKQIIRTARSIGKPVVVATQMMESMIENPAPTRAEASDVATAVYDGADAVMLSAETAVGNYPVEAVSIMNRILEQTEQDPHARALLDAGRDRPEATASDAISAAARQTTQTIPCAAIVCFTMSGKTAYRVSRERPEAYIVGLTASRSTARRMTLAWGVEPYVTADVDEFWEMIEHACTSAVASGLVRRAGERIVVTAGVPFGTAGATNLLHLATIREDHMAAALKDNG